MYMGKTSGEAGRQAMNLHSDQALVAALQRRNVAALSHLYDRYATLVFTLACHSRPEAAESVIEGVFLELWRGGTAATISGSVLPTLSSLTAQKLALHRTGAGERGGHLLPEDALPALAPFAALPALVYEVMVLTHLGQLGVEEIATALAIDRTAVTRALAAGFAALRNLSTGRGDGASRAGESDAPRSRPVCGT